MKWHDFDNLASLPDEFFDVEKFGPRRVHFIGIGGIGMSALAFVLASRGHRISGSDAYESAMLDKLREAGVLCAVGQREENLHLLGEPVEAVIFGSAIAPDNPERVAAQKHGNPEWHRAQLLAYFVNNAEFSIAVSGTHGKSTTSAMIAHILDRCGKNPTAILGAEYPPFGSNARIGDPDLIVVEADESDGSFTLLKPTVAVVTNVEPEHLENYDDSEDELWRAFKLFVSQSFIAVLNRDESVMFKRLNKGLSVTVSYALHEVKTLPELQSLHVGVPGVHNLSNALAALAVALDCGVPIEDIKRELANFYGVKRRFQKIGGANNIVIYDDYAHHPTEVESTLRAAKEFLARPVAVIFQPHRYSRTQQLGRAFGPSFEAADKVIITQLYSAFEEPIEGVSGRIVFDAVCEAFPEKRVLYAESLDEAKRFALEIVEPGDALFTMGAGDVSTLAPQLLDELQQRAHSRAPLRGVTEGEALARHTTMKIGGTAKYWFEPQSADELQAVLEWIEQRGLPLYVLGAGSNVIATDDGFDGAVFHLGKGFETWRVEGSTLVAGGAAMLPRLTHVALENDLGNFEWACGVPGSVGGSLWGNAGARGWNGSDFETRDIAADLQSLVAFERDGRRRVLSRDDIEFSYRKSSLGKLIVAQATFALKPLDAKQTQRHREAVKELLARRKATQPVNAACAGCIWKNPKIEKGEYSGCGAGALIEKLGLKGVRVGGAEVSEIHGNFIINTGNATGADVFNLIAQIEAEVLHATRVRLEREVRIMPSR